MSLRKYVICPGFVRSRNDGERHFVGSHALQRLYRVANDEAELFVAGEKYPRGTVFLRPRIDGDYRKPALPSETALFVPLMAWAFEKFERGEKDLEFRKYGTRWNERTCRVGRRVTLSHGYGKQRRLHGVIVAFGRTPGEQLVNNEDFRACYGDLPADCAIIGIKLDGKGACRG